MKNFTPEATRAALDFVSRHEVFQDAFPESKWKARMAGTCPRKMSSLTKWFRPCRNVSYGFTVKLSTMAGHGRLDFVVETSERRGTSEPKVIGTRVHRLSSPDSVPAMLHNAVSETAALANAIFLMAAKEKTRRR